MCTTNAIGSQLSGSGLPAIVGVPVDTLGTSSGDSCHGFLGFGKLVSIRVSVMTAHRSLNPNASAIKGGRGGLVVAVIHMFDVVVFNLEGIGAS